MIIFPSFKTHRISISEEDDRAVLITQVGVMRDLVVAHIKTLEARESFADRLHCSHAQDVDSIVLEGDLLDFSERGKAFSYPLELTCSYLHCLYLQSPQSQLL
jgi:alpha-D-ribose 1-methylphosphonate 5-phosphate C-P lyase